MKTQFSKLIFSSMLFALLSVNFANVSAVAENDRSMEEFWAKFKAAVQKVDKTSVAAMSQLPIEMPYGVSKVRTRVQLVRRWREVFNVQSDATKCFEDAKPVLDSANRNRFTVGCKDAAGNEVVVYGFVRTRVGWKLKSLDNINE